MRHWVGEEVLGGAGGFQVFLVFAILAALQEVTLILLLGRIGFSVLVTLVVNGAMLMYGFFLYKLSSPDEKPAEGFSSTKPNRRNPPNPSLQARLSNLAGMLG